MAVGAGSTAAAEPEGTEGGILMRALRALELLVSAHARLARLEAKNDLARIASGLFLAGLALALAGMAAILGHVVLVLALEARLAWGLPASIGAVAAADVALAVVLMLVARARLQAPVLVETRSMMTKAASTLRG